ncbi:low temperature requirement protein A [Tabrizicola sp. BL-A-41-H6]|uniref:low temperature requirement protein A n=1 Tax=Tabrizicola sp. BL-A-41-H6 TaxID=3421107 RepID=UPI003D66D3BA
MTNHVLIHEDGRKATWFELFFDLVFVVAVAALAGSLSQQYNWSGVLEFGFLFLVLWWLWLGHTFHASRFDKDRPDQWAIGFAQILGVVFIAYGAGDAFGVRAWAFAGGVAAFKALLMLGYLREIVRPGLGRLCTIYGAIYGLQAALWAGSILAEPTLRTALWAVALALDIVSPFLVASETHRAPPHPEHLPERFGLFTIILLGETAAASVHALDHGSELHGDTLAVALLGALLGFLYWVGYFRRAKGNAERHVGDAAAGRSLRLWAYGHIPLYLGIASLGAGTVYLAHHTALDGAAPWIFSVGAALSMGGVTIVSLATHQRSLASGWPYFLIALMAAASPVMVSTAPVLVGYLAVLAACQIGLSLNLNRNTQARH